MNLENDTLEWLVELHVLKDLDFESVSLYLLDVVVKVTFQFLFC